MHDQLLACPEPGRQSVSVGVAGEEHRLKEDHAGIPDGRRAAQLGQNHLGDHRLDQEEQSGADEQGESKEKRQGILSGRGTLKSED